MPDRGAKKIADVTGQLRATLHPLASTVGPDASLTVGGWQAEDADFSAKLGSATPLVVLVVLGLALLILLAAFRSPILAVGVIMLNLMSVGVAYGVLAAVFQHTWAEGLLGFTSSGSVANWIPLFLFVILFGLSMDYTILVLERIREARLAGRSPREAAAEGVAATAGTVTSAAIVMVAVFLLFAIMQFPDNKQLGVGLSTAILIDATLVRGVMLPALVAVIGDRWRFSPPPPRGRAAVVVPSEAAA
jgi:RND superfamily putative drug exporter